MNRQEIEKLLGGYATGTLTNEEEQALFAAALEDQELFDALAKEQALREVLDDPAARQQVIEALGGAREPFPARAWNWLRRPASLAMAGGLAALVVVGGLVLYQREPLPRQEVKMADAVTAQRRESSAALPKPFQSPAAPRQTAKMARLPQPPALARQNELAAPPPAARLALAEHAAIIPRAADQEVSISQSAPTEPGSTAHFISGALKRAKAIPDHRNSGVSYKLLLKAPDGEYLPALPGAAFHAGDSVRLQVEPLDAGYLQLLRKNESGTWDLIASQRAEKGQRYVMPASGSLDSNIPAQVELRLLLSHNGDTNLPAKDVDSLPALSIVLEFR